MTAAAQVVTTRAPSAPPSRSKDDASVRQPGTTNGFEKALDRADAASSEPVPPRADETVPARRQPQEAGSQSSSARGRSRGSETEPADDAATEPSADVASSDQVSVTQAPGFALALAALTATALQQDPSVAQAGQAQAENAQPASDEAMLSAILSGSGATSKPQDPQLPSDTDPLTETLSLLGISEDDVADVQASADQTAVKVVGQQTHLAMSQKVSVAVEAHSAQLQAAAKAPAGSDAAGATQRGDAPVSVPALTGEQVPTAAATSNDGDSSTSGQERRQPDGGQAQQTSSATQTGLPAGPQATGISSVGTASSATFESYTDSLSPGGQIARSVKAEIAGTDTAGSNANGVLKVLQIELKPQNLGSVTVRLSLKDDVISLHMETSRPETAAAIEKERSALTSALKAAGYVVDEITAQPMDISRAAQGRVEAATNDASMSSSFAQGDGRSQAQQEFSSFGRGQGGQRGASGDVSLTPSNSAGDGAGEMSRSRTGAIYV